MNTDLCSTNRTSGPARAHMQKCKPGSGNPDLVVINIKKE